MSDNKTVPLLNHRSLPVNISKVCGNVGKLSGILTVMSGNLERFYSIYGRVNC